MAVCGPPLKEVCKWNHRKAIVGRDKRGQCRQCLKERKFRRPDSFRQEKWVRYKITDGDGLPFTWASYRRLISFQQSRCAVCGIHQSSLKTALAVDHDHATSKARGLLCSECNIRVVKVVEDYFDRIQKAQLYLAQFQTKEK